MKLKITYYTFGDSLKTVELDVCDLDAAIALLESDEEKYMFAQLMSYEIIS